MGWSTLARFAAWAALILAFFGAIYWAASEVHKNIFNKGVTAERLIWEEREVLKANANARETSRLTELAAKQRARFMKETKNAENKRVKLVGDIIDLRIAGLQFTADCGSGSADGTGEDPDTGVNGGGLTTVRLPEKIEGDLLGMTKNAQVCVIHYDLLREKMKSMPNVVIVPDS